MHAPPPWPPPSPYGSQQWGAPPPRRSGGAAIGLVLAAVGVLLVLVVGLIGGVAFYTARKRAKKAAPVAVWSDRDSPIPISSDDPVRGPRDALVTIVVFEDFQCPFCKRVEDTLRDVRAIYGDDVRIAWKDNPLPFHQDARPAAIAARGVFELGGNDAFWRWHDRAYAQQNALTQSSFDRWAREEGVDVTELREGIAEHRWDAKIDDNVALAKMLGATGTPTAFVNGVKVSGAQPLAAWQRVIDDELSKARAKVASGTPRDRIYVETSQDNYAKPAPPPAPTYPPPTRGAATLVQAVPIAGSPARGPDTALVTIVVFSDFQCPFCKRSAPILERLRKEYGNELRVVGKNEPLAFHRDAEPAAELALEARAQGGDAAFWRAHDMLFDESPKLSNADLLSIAGRLGLDKTKVATAIATHKHKSTIDADAALAASLGATGTPTFFINGRKLVGAQPYDAFHDVIEEERPKAKAKLASGTPPNKLYDELVLKGASPPMAPLPPPSTTLGF
jgi:protein-disulfide isomerase